jgi:hypothetical protein
MGVGGIPACEIRHAISLISIQSFEYPHAARANGREGWALILRRGT